MDAQPTPPESTPPPPDAQREPYEPPRLTRLGDLTNLLAGKSGFSQDPSDPIHFNKK